MDLTPLVRLFHLVLPYAGVTIAAIVEGEIAYIGAAVLVAHGQLHPAGVVLAGAAGAAIGDQAYFYVFRGHLPRWLARFPSLEQKAAPLVERVRRHQTLMVLLIRFAPGLRIAIAAACAWVEVPPLQFSVLNLLSALVWAAGLVVLVGWLGPTFLAQYGLGGWKGALVIGVAVFGLLKVFGWFGRRAMRRGKSSYAGQQPLANP
jgi:membrane-associated protein